MELNSSQLLTLRTWALARLAENNQQNEQQLAALANAAASPAYFVWRTTLNKHELTDDAGIADDGVTATAFTWGGSSGGYINRSQGERDAFNQLFNTTLACKPNLANVRTAFDDIFSGSGAGAVANRGHWRAKARRTATTAEKLFVTATAGGPTQTGNRGTRTNPDTLGPEGEVTPQNIIDALS